MYQMNRRKIQLNLKERLNDVVREQDCLLNQVNYLKKAFEKTELKLLTLEKLLPYGLWWCNARGELKYVSDSYLKLRGLTLSQIKDFGWVKFEPKVDEKELLSKWKKCISNGETWEYIFKFIGPDGLIHTLLSKGVPTRNSAGYIISWIGAYFPVSTPVANNETNILIKHEQMAQKIVKKRIKLQNTPK